MATIITFNQANIISTYKEIDFVILKSTLDITFSDNVTFSYNNLSAIDCTFINTLTAPQITTANNIFNNHNGSKNNSTTSYPILHEIEKLFDTNFSKETVSATGTIIGVSSGTAASAILSTATPDFKCIPLFTGTTTTGSAYWRAPNALLWTTARNVFFTIEFDIQILFNSNATNRSTVRSGLQLTSNFIADNSGFYFRYVDNVNSGNYQCVVRNGASETVINTTILGGMTGGQKACKIEISVISGVTSVLFYINGVVQNNGVPITTNIPATNIQLFIGSGNKKSTGTTSVSFYNSYFRILKQYLAGTRF